MRHFIDAILLFIERNEKNMYKVNEMVLYGNEGVCQIKDITKRSFKGKEVEYYVLKPVFVQGSTVYVPVDNPELNAKMKKILSAEEIIDLIHNMPNQQLPWIENDNLRKEKYREILKNGDRQELIQLIRTLYLHQQELKKAGKKFHATDEKILNEAEKILHHEFAYVLDIKLEEVVPFISKEINIEERKKAFYE